MHGSQNYPGLSSARKQQYPTTRTSWASFRMHAARTPWSSVDSHAAVSMPVDNCKSDCSAPMGEGHGLLAESRQLSLLAICGIILVTKNATMKENTVHEDEQCHLKRCIVPPHCVGAETRQHAMPMARDTDYWPGASSGVCSMPGITPDCQQRHREESAT